jgi:V-type H+-transporting ATPase subunit d
MADFSLLQI